jgi:hypothetical protein
MSVSNFCGCPLLPPLSLSLSLSLSVCLSVSFSLSHSHTHTPVRVGTRDLADPMSVADILSAVEY